MRQSYTFSIALLTSPNCLSVNDVYPVDGFDLVEYIISWGLNLLMVVFYSFYIRD